VLVAKVQYNPHNPDKAEETHLNRIQLLLKLNRFGARYRFGFHYRLLGLNVGGVPLGTQPI